MKLRHTAPAEPQIGYILKGFARTSETFITNEIVQLEKRGLHLKIYSLLELTGQARHAVVDEVQAKPSFLPSFTPTAESHPLVWLVQNVFPYLKSHARVFAIRPRRYFKTLREALRLSFDLRAGWARPDATSLKEFLQAGYIADHALAEGRIHHLHAHFCHTATTVAMYAAAITGIPFSFTAHAKDIYVRDLNPGDLLQRKLRRAKFAVTCTAANQRHLETIEPQGAPIHTIYHGLDANQFTPVEPRIDSDAPLILSVGRMVEKKGFPDLVEACLQLKARGIRFRCLILGGGGPEAERLALMIKAHGLENIIEIKPAVPQESLREIYGRAAVFALPCRIAQNLDRDGIPNVLVEAMAMGLPVVSTTVSGIPELIDSSVDGLLVPQQDPEALANALAMLIGQSELRQRLGAAAREKVRRSFQASDHILALHKLFLSCLNQNRAVESRPFGEKAEAKQ
jgi:glycosyltransferase involved in cell wall biosynthesis